MTAVVASPVGPLSADSDGAAITRLQWNDKGTLTEGALAAAFVAQLTEYFAGTRTDFDLPLAPAGSAFQQRFHDALLAIPYGNTRTYGELSKDLDVSPQAIGQACGANPIAILIPCHRVLAADGLGGYSGSGGIETKVALLRLEGAAGLLI